MAFLRHFIEYTHSRWSSEVIAPVGVKRAKPWQETVLEQVISLK